ncbi:MAG: class I SAM-dependent methyltransferase [Chloroflexi bacterium]|nr:class I SAM-dependent methyltransferase [Chloroflexota bacterium]
MENVALLPVGRVLDVAMGYGRNALYLARLGFTVEGVDISREAVDTALAKAHQAGLSLKTTVADLEESGYRIKRGAYDAIICFDYLQRSLVPQIRQGLRAGGVVVFETFIVDQARLFGRPRNPEHLLQHNELLKMFRRFRCLRYREGLVEPGRAMAGIVAQKRQPGASSG